MQKQADHVDENQGDENTNVEVVDPIHMNALRRSFDYVVNIDLRKGIQYREAIRDNTAMNSILKSKSDWLKFSLVKLSEANPLLFLVGVLSWIYLLTYVLLKLTVLV